MQSVMNGQGHEGIPGAPQLTGPEGAEDHRSRILVGAFSCAPVAVPSREIVVPSRDVQVVAHHLVADLHDPSLVISPDYVGHDRRRTGRSVSPKAGVPPWLRRVMQVVVLTTLVVVPLTMMAAHSIPPAAAGPSSTQVQPSGKAGTASGGAPEHRAAHVFTATPQQIARAEAAYRRALARVDPSGAVAPTAAQGPAGRGAALTAERTEAAQAATSAAIGRQEVAATAAAQQRAASQAQTAQKRATDQAAATQLRVEHAATRAGNQARRAAARSGVDQGAPD
jgi:hypothetical protein